MRKSVFKVGQRYTYPSKELCIKVSKKAKEEGFQVRYGISDFGSYYFEIIDPFEE